MLNETLAGHLARQENDMNKVVLGLLVGGILGIFDGLSAWFTPAVRAQLLTIVIGSTVKGLIAGIFIGYFAKKVNSLPLGLLFGLGVGLLLAYAVAAMPDPNGKHYYFEIMLPGGLVGMIVGYATQRFGQSMQLAGK
jgi:peptidoglycan/LPS O-acetylase OafA/YrhL